MGDLKMMKGARDLRYFGGVVIASGGTFVFTGDQTGWDFIQILKTSGNLQVQFDSGPFFPLWARSTLRNAFKQLILAAASSSQITPAPAGGVTCDFLIGKGDTGDLPDVQDIIDTCDSPAVVVCGATSQTQICSSSKDVWRRQLINVSVTAVSLYIGDANVANATGYLLQQNMSMTLYGGGSIFAYNNNAAACKLSFTEEKY